MTENEFELIKRTFRLHKVMDTDDAKADIIRDEMDVFWKQITREQKKQIDLISCWIYAMSDQGDMNDRYNEILFGDKNDLD